MSSRQESKSRKKPRPKSKGKRDVGVIVCQKCGQRSMPKSQIEGDEWLCPECDDRGIVWPFMNWIQDKIRRLTTEGEHRGRMAVREVVQNADDAEADTIIFRFEEDALYVANNGRAFKTGPDGDFDRLRRILGEHKKKEEKVTGYYGSGFWTVYIIANTPEVHSNGYSRWIDPVKQEWNNYNLDSPEFRMSPYANQRRKGVLFRFAWRTEEEARKLFREEQPFIGEEWPKWTEVDRLDMYNDLREYLPSLILCARNLKHIGVVWANDSEKGHRGLLVSREFVPSRIEIPTVASLRIMETIVDDDFNKSFDTSCWKIQKESTLQYLVNTGNVRNLNTQSIRWIARGQDVASELAVLHIVHRRDDDAAPTVIKEFPDGVPDEFMQRKQPDMQIIMPIASSADQDIPIACVYSYMPLPIDSPNRFALNADVFVDESRKGIVIKGKEGDWYYHAIFSLALLYLETFSYLVKYLKRQEISNELKQRIILDNLPGGSLRHWMRPGTTDDRVKGNYDSLDEHVIEKVMSQEILFANGKWVKPRESYWIESGDEGHLPEDIALLYEILGKIGVPILSDNIIKHPNFVSWLQNGLEQFKSGPENFLKIWNNYLKKNRLEDGNIALGDTCGNGTLTDDVVAKLVRYGFKYHGNDSRIRSLQIVPAKDGRLYSIKELKPIPKEYEELERILPKSRIIDFSIIDESHLAESDYYSLLEILRLVSRIYLSSPKLFEDTNGKHFQSAAKVLAEACRSRDAFNLDAVGDYHFIPCVKHGKGLLCKPNAYKMETETIWEYGRDGRNLPLYYEQDHIFISSEDVLDTPGITPEVLNGITFLHLPTAAQMELIAKRLPLIRLQKAPLPGSLRPWVGIFLSGKRSLFHEENLNSFFHQPVSEEDLFAQRRQFQESLKVYFRKGERTERIVAKSQWRDVPCLYDSSEEWHPAKKFAYEIDDDTAFFGYRPLNEEFKKEGWTKAALLAIGVAEHPEPDTIQNKVKSLLENPKKNREKFVDIAIYLLLAKLEESTELDECVAILNTLNWIPISDNGESLKKPREVLLPSESNVRILGKSFPKFLSVSINQGKKIQDYIDSLSPKKMNEWEPRLGFRVLPTIGDLLSVVASSKGKPPPDLFDELEKKVKDGEWDYSYDSSSLRYYHNNSWLTMNEMVLTKDKDAPESFSLIIEVHECPHENYIREIGVKPKLDVEMALEWLTSNPKHAMPEVWKWMAKKYRQMETKIQSELGNEIAESKIVPVGNRKVPPASIIVLNPGVPLNEPIFTTNLTLVTEAHLPIEKQSEIGILYDLGSKQLDDCSPEELNNLLKRISKMLISAPSEAGARLFYNLLQRLAEYSTDEKVPGGKTPVKMNERWTMVPTGKVLYPDSAAAVRFVDDLAVLPIGLVRGSESLGILLRNDKNSVRNFTQYLDAGSGASLEYSPVQTERLRHALEAVGIYLGSKQLAEPLNWWQNVEVCYADTTTVSYRVTLPGRKPIERDAIDDPHLDTKDQGWVLLIPHMGPEGIYESITDLLLVNRTGDQEIPRRGELKLLVPQLLRLPPADWLRFVPEYRYKGGFISPMVMYLSGSSLEEHWSYQKTLEELLGYYPGCQICGTRTPSEWESPSTRETLKQIFSPVRGMPLQLTIEGYKVGNSLLLCPRHHYLFERKCVRLQLLRKFIGCLPEEGGSLVEMEKTASHLRRRYKQIDAEETEEYTVDCEIWDNKSLDGIHSGILNVTTAPMFFKRRHYLELLKWMHVYLEKRIAEGKH